MRIRSKRGQALIEFALILPILIILLLGIIEVSILLYDKAVITNASREGARYGIVSRTPRYTEDQIKAVITTYCTSRLVTFGGSTSPDAHAYYTTQQFGDELKVSVSYNYRYLVLPNFLGIGNTVSLKAMTVMKYE